MKGFRHKPEAKKEAINWTKYFVVAACVLFAVFMVVSMLGMSWLNIFSQAEPGSNAVMDFTIRDAQDRPVVTTASNTFAKGQEANQMVMKAEKLPVRVNISETRELVPIQVMTASNQGGLMDFGLFGPEVDAISFGALGMKVGESRTVRIPMAAQLSRTMTKDQYTNITGESFETAKVGDQVPVAFTETPQIAVDNATPTNYLRVSTITAISGENLTINYGYPTIEITLSELKSS